MSLDSPQSSTRDPESRTRPAVHPVDEVLPAHKLFVFGLQHLFIMYAGAVAVPLIVGPAIGLHSRDIATLVSADLLVSGIATIIQSAGISKLFGVRLPVVDGAMLCSGVFGLIIAKPFSMVVRFFPPLVAGTVICMIGLSLAGADISLIYGDPQAGDRYVGGVGRIGLAGLVLVMILVISRIFRGFVGQIAVLLSIVIGTVVASFMNLVHFGNVKDSGWFGAPHIFHF